jgi:hypothetical protein
MNKEWITVNEASRLSGYSPEYLRRLIRNSKIKAEKISIVWVVERSSFLSYLGSGKDSDDQRRGPRKTTSGLD